MNDIADELRQVLADRAHDAPPGLELPMAAKALARRRATRHRVAYVGFAALAVTIGASAIPVLLHDNTPRVHPGGSPATTGPPSPTASPTPACAVQFAPATSQPTVSFPYRPTFVPPGVPPASVFRTYSDFIAHARQLDAGVPLAVHRYDAAPILAEVDGMETATPQPVQVHGHAGQIAIAGDIIFVYWKETADTWLGVHSEGVSRTDVLRYADGLQATPLTGTEAYHFDLVPVDMDLHESLHWSMTFAPSGAGSSAEPLIGVTVDKAGTTEPPPGSTPVQVGPYQGHLSTQDGGRDVLVDLPGGAKMDVIVPEGCADADLIAFAAGITVDLNSI